MVIKIYIVENIDTV